jgi:prophage regulatory protein
MNSYQPKPQDRLLTAQDVLKLTGLKSRVTLWRKCKDQNDPFPRPYRFGPQSKRWKLSELDAWMNQLETV